MSYFALSNIVIDEEKLKKLDSYKQFKNTLSNLNVDIEDFAYSNQEGEEYFNNKFERLSKKEVCAIEKHYNNFKIDFCTSYGFKISIGYHSSESDGCCHDEINGWYFFLDFEEVYQLTPKAESLATEFDFRLLSYVKN